MFSFDDMGWMIDKHVLWLWMWHDEMLHEMIDMKILKEWICAIVQIVYDKLKKKKLKKKGQTWQYNEHDS